MVGSGNTPPTRVSSEGGSGGSSGLGGGCFIHRKDLKKGDQWLKKKKYKKTRTKDPNDVSHIVWATFLVPVPSPCLVIVVVVVIRIKKTCKYMLVKLEKKKHTRLNTHQDTYWALALVIWRDTKPRDASKRVWASSWWWWYYVVMVLLVWWRWWWWPFVGCIVADGGSSSSSGLSLMYHTPSLYIKNVSKVKNVNIKKKT